MIQKNNFVDINSLKFNQISIITFLLIGYIFNLESLVYLIAIIMILGSIKPNLSVFKQIYKNIILKMKLVKPNIIQDFQTPHNFAQLMGGIVLAIASILFFLKFTILSWALVWIVILLALLNIVIGFCLGCFIYFQLSKLKIPGFRNQTQRV